MLPAVFYQLFSHTFTIIDRTTAEAGITLSFLKVQGISQAITKRSTLLLASLLLVIAQFKKETNQEANTKENTSVHPVFNYLFSFY